MMVGLGKVIKPLLTVFNFIQFHKYHIYYILTNIWHLKANELQIGIITLIL